LTYTAAVMGLLFALFAALGRSSFLGNEGCTLASKTPSIFRITEAICEARPSW
jgi:hypothetical protein